MLCQGLDQRSIEYYHNEQSQTCDGSPSLNDSE